MFHLADFLKEYRHPDFRLYVMLDIGIDVTGTWLYDMVSVLRSKIYADVGIRIKKNAVIDSENLKTMASFCKEVVFWMSDDYASYDSNMAYFVARKVPVVAELMVDERTSKSIKAFKDFYAVMRMQNVYKINYFYLFSEKKQFLRDVIKEFEAIVQSDKSLGYIAEINPERRTFCPSFEKSFTYHLNGDITHCHIKNDIVLSEDSRINSGSFERVKGKIDLSKCTECVAIENCGGGCYAVFEAGQNSDLFCAMNMAFQCIKNDFLSGGK